MPPPPKHTISQSIQHIFKNMPLLEDYWIWFIYCPVDFIKYMTLTIYMYYKNNTFFNKYL